MSLNTSIFDVYTKQKDYNITFTHVPTDSVVSFAAFITSFSDAYSSNWAPETVYGRADPIQTFGGTSRKINFEFMVLSNDLEEARKNLDSLRLLGRMMYPTYIDDTNATTISKAPVIRIKFANLVGRGGNGTGTALLGVMSGFTINPVVDPGFFDPDAGILYAKEYTATVDFSVLHEESPGRWIEYQDQGPQQDPLQGPVLSGPNDPYRGVGVDYDQTAFDALIQDNNRVLWNGAETPAGLGMSQLEFDVALGRTEQFTITETVEQEETAAQEETVLQ